MSDPCDYTHKPSQSHDNLGKCVLQHPKCSFLMEAVIAEKIGCDNGFDIFSMTKNLTCTHRSYILLVLCLLLIFRCPKCY